eukprot:TRINITY_DN11418_c0_g2_i1.p1 TRINITY_DN11418_c0_g2~~TRINITY_DN11418_c0_g2_i1.p1  ORF type:complete len:583 (-),score=134.76 TRINITY_DN11418_c0_g2_i1:380-2128(-)
MALRVAVATLAFCLAVPRAASPAPLSGLPRAANAATARLGFRGSASPGNASAAPRAAGAGGGGGGGFSWARLAENVARDVRVHDAGSVNISVLPNPLGGNSREVVNGSFHAILGLLTAAIVAGLVLEEGSLRKGKGRPKLWLVGMISASYVLLFPGIFSVLVSYNVFVELHFNLLFVPFDVAYNMTEEAITETMAGLIAALYRTGGWLGAALVITYAIILPLLKIVLLLVGERWRFSEIPQQRLRARRAILFVQAVSKWASPDMFAYIMIEYLLRNLGHPPEVQSKAALDVGFICFSIFCISSTFSSLAITPPAAPAVVERKPPKWLQSLHQDGATRLVHAAAALYCLCLSVGLFVPCMGLRLSIDSLLEPNGPVPQSMEGFLKSLHLEDKVKAEVTPWECMWALLGWASNGEATSLVGFLLLTFFVLVIPTLDVVVLLAMLALPARNGERELRLPREDPDAVASAVDGPEAPSTPRDLLARASWVLHHIAMLDVFCMGVIVVCLAGAAYKKMGIDIELRWGIILLTCAEAAHMLAHTISSHVLGEHGTPTPVVADGCGEDDLDRGDASDRRQLLATEDPLE